MYKYKNYLIYALIFVLCFTGSGIASAGEVIIPAATPETSFVDEDNIVPTDNAIPIEDLTKDETEQTPIITAESTSGSSIGINTLLDAESTSGSAINLKTLPYINVKDFGAKGNANYLYKGSYYEDAEHTIPANDDTAAIQIAADKLVERTPKGGRMIFPNGNYLISGTINVYPSVIVEGESRATRIVNTNSAQYCFYMHSDRWELYGGGFLNITFVSRYGIKFNDDDPANFENDFHTHNIKIDSCFFNGEYSKALDTKSGTSEVPTVTELESYGVGIKASKMFMLVVTNCHFNRMGIGAYLYGCDISTINYNRISNGGIAVYATNSNNSKNKSFGFQVEIAHNDLCQNHRRRVVWLANEIRACVIRDNYFEVTDNENTGEFFRVDGGWDNVFDANRIDNPYNYIKNSTEPLCPILSIGNCVKQLQVKNNRLGFVFGKPLSEWKTTVQIDEPGTKGSDYAATWYVSTIRKNIQWIGNNEYFPVPDHPLVDTQGYNDPYIFNYKNTKYIDS